MPSKNQVIEVTTTSSGMTAELVDDTTRSAKAASSVVSGCFTSDTSDLKFLESCVRNAVASEISDLNDRLSLEKGIREGMARMLEDYTCEDEEVSWRASHEERASHGRTSQ